MKGKAKGSPTERVIAFLKANDVEYFKSGELEVRFRAAPAPSPAPIHAPQMSVPNQAPFPVAAMQSKPAPPSAAAIPPVESEIPHHVNEVRSLLRLSDNDLAEKLFPDYSQANQAQDKGR